MNEINIILHTIKLDGMEIFSRLNDVNDMSDISEDH